MKGSKGKKSSPKKKIKTSRPENLQALLKKIESSIWPMERDVLFRPDRLKYIRKLISTETCVFCESAKSVSFETLCVFQSKHSMIVLNKYPYNGGHLLILPKRHCGDLLKLDDDEFTDLQNTVKIGFQAVQEAFNPEGINFGLNHGRVSGAGIPDHLHYHIIPRWFGDLNFFPLIADTKVVVLSLEEVYQRLENYFLRKFKGIKLKSK